MARAVVGYRERAVPVACWPSTINGCSYELSIGLTISLKTIDGDCWNAGASISLQVNDSLLGRAEMRFIV